MFHPLVLLIGALATNIVGSYASGIGPSQTPSCYTCPASDQSDYPLGESSTTGNTLFCSYPAYEGGDPDDFYCTYDKTNGNVLLDRDFGDCPDEATSCDTRRRRRNALPRSPLPSTPNPRSPKPDVMQTRRKLGLMKRSANA